MINHNHRLTLLGIEELALTPRCPLMPVMGNPRQTTADTASTRDTYRTTRSKT